MVGRSLGGVVSDAALLGDGGVGARGQDEVPAKALFFPGLEGFVSDEVAARHIDAEGEVPAVIGDVPGRVARDKDAGGHTDGIEAAESEGHLVEHGANAGAVGDVGAEPNRQSAATDPAARHSDPETVLVRDLLGRGGGGFLLQIHAHDVRSVLHDSVGGFFPDAAAGSDHDDHLPGEFFFGGHPAQFGLFEEPVFDVEGFLLWQGDVFVDGLGSAHDFDRAVVKFGGDPGFALVLAPGDHAEAGDEHHGRVGVADGGGVGVFAALVVGSVVFTVLNKTFLEKGFEGRDITRGGVPVDVEGLDFGAQEMIRAAGAELCEAWGVLAVDEAEDGLVVLDCADEAAVLADLAAQPGENGGEGRVALGLGKGLVFGAPECSGVPALGLVLGLDVFGSFFDEAEGAGVALLFIVMPRNEPVLAHHDGLQFGVFLGDLLHGQTELKAGAHPGNVGHRAPENLAGEFLTAPGGRDRNNRIGVHVIHVFSGKETVERGVDGGRPRIQVEGRVGVHTHHVVLGLGLQPLVGAGGVGTLEFDELVLVEGRKIFAGAGAQVASGAFDPEHLHGLTGERVFFLNLGGGISATRIGDALVAAEEVGAINETAHGVERSCLGIVPQVVDVTE